MIINKEGDQGMRWLGVTYLEYHLEVWAPSAEMIRTKEGEQGMRLVKVITLNIIFFLGLDSSLCDDSYYGG
jgi:hypothetical protein